MAVPLKSPFKELELQEFKLPAAGSSEDVRIPLLASEKPVYKPVLCKIHEFLLYFQGPDAVLSRENVAARAFLRT